MGDAVERITNVLWGIGLDSFGEERISRWVVVNTLTKERKII